MTRKAFLARISPALNQSRSCIRPSLSPAFRPSRRPTLSRQPGAFRAIVARHASTAQETATETQSAATRFKNVLLGTSIALFVGFGYLYITDTRAGLHRWIVVPALRFIYDDAEEAHHAGTKALRALHSFGLHPRERGNPDAMGDLSVEVFGHVLSNPMGISAGLDKKGELPTSLLELGPAIVEIGGVTPLPQAGNPTPRVFRIPSQNALINRYGLNSEGAAAVAIRLRQRVREFAYQIGFGIDEEAERMVLDGEAGVPPGSLVEGKLMAVQIAKNKDTPDSDIEAVERDYVHCVQQLGKYADIIVVNVSSPNTPGLRSLQNVEPLTHILTGVVQAAKAVQRKSKPTVMVKVSPDEDLDDQILGICEAVWEAGVDGVIVGNTTKKRPDPVPKGFIMPDGEKVLLDEQGGYSGPQMFEKTLSLVRRYRKHLDEGPRIAPPLAQEPPEPASDPTASDGPGSTTAGEPEPDAAVPLEASELADAKPAAELPNEDMPLSSNSDDLTESGSALTVSSPADDEPVPLTQPEIPEPLNPFSYPPKVIFATGGITNGRQALEILNAGASVSMVYTAMVYGGVGTVSRMKQEMRDEMRKR